MSLHRIFEWPAANRYPRLTQLCVFVAGVIALGSLAYFRFADEKLVLSALVGVLGGAVLIVVVKRYQRDPVAASAQAARRHSFEVALAGIGLVLALVGAMASWTLAVSGVAFLVIAMILVGVKRVYDRRS